MTIKQPFLRTPYNYDTNKAGDESGLDTGTDGGAKQSFKDECDINIILKRFGLGYEIPTGLRMPQPGDFVGVDNFHDAMNQIRQAQETFDALPAHIRAEFKNSPGNFHDFAVNPDNLEKMAEMGLLNERGQERARIAQEQRNLKNDAEAAERHSKRQSASKDADQQPAPRKA